MQPPFVLARSSAVTPAKSNTESDGCATLKKISKNSRSEALRSVPDSIRIQTLLKKPSLGLRMKPDFLFAKRPIILKHRADAMHVSKPAAHLKLLQSA